MQMFFILQFLIPSKMIDYFFVFLQKNQEKSLTFKTIFGTIYDYKITLKLVARK